MKKKKEKKKKENKPAQDCSSGTCSANQVCSIAGSGYNTHSCALAQPCAQTSIL